MTPELKAALGEAYTAFMSYKDSYGFAGRSGVRHSLRQLTREDWAQMDAEFDMGVQLYSDNKNELFRHFLPRWLEWLSDDFYSHYLDDWAFWDLGYRLNQARWLQWPPEEVEALRGVFKAWAHQELAKHDGEIPLRFLLDIKDDLSPYLDVWLQARPVEVAQWLWTIDWNEHADAQKWATKPRVEERLEAAFFAHPDSAQAALLSRSIELMRSLRGL